MIYALAHGFTAIVLVSLLQSIFILWREAAICPGTASLL
jgi:hypothetical protein